MKFKVWDSKNKKFVDETDDGYKFFIFPDGSLNVLTNWNEFDGPADPHYQAVYSTEITDKDGVELLDGDQCICDGEYPCEISFNNGCFIVSFASTVFYLLHESAHRLGRVCNKLENPELLDSGTDNADSEVIKNPCVECGKEWNDSKEDECPHCGNVVPF